MLLTLLLLACSSDAMMGDEALRQIDDMRALVADHREAVYGAGSVDEVTPMEAAHTEEMGSMMADMHGMMGSMMGCDMGEMMSGSMSDADDHMRQMMDSASSHEADHGDHAALSACLDDEDRYAAMMEEHLSAMSDDIDGFDEDAECSGGHGGMMDMDGA